MKKYVIGGSEGPTSIFLAGIIEKDILKRIIIIWFVFTATILSLILIIIKNK